MISRVKRKIERSWRKALFLANMEGLLYKGKHHGDLIIMYHNVDIRGDRRFNQRFISRSDFRRQMLYLHKEYTIVPLSQMFEQKNPGVRRLAITFDDGLRNNFKHAAPILRHLSIPATFFCSAARSIGESILWPDALNICTFFWAKPVELEGKVYHPRPWNRYSADDDEQLMSKMKTLSHEQRWEFINVLKTAIGFDPFETVNSDYYEIMSPKEMRALAAHPLFEIGSHAITHSNLGLLSPQAADRELLHSKDYLEEVIRKEITSIAYPDGSYTEETKGLSVGAGYRYQLAVNYHYDADREDNRILDRFGLYSDRSYIEQLHQVNQAFHEKP